MSYAGTTVTDNEKDQALSSFSRVSSTTKPADLTCVSSYRKWLTEHRPIASSETQFLDAPDLIAFNTEASGVTQISARYISDEHKLSAGLVITAFLFLFKLVPFLAVRLFFLYLFLAFLAFVAVPEEGTGTTDKTEEWKLGVLFAGVMTMLAIMM